MFERFDEAARAIIVHAQAEARDVGDARIGSEHVLLGVLAVPNAAAALLAAHGLHLQEVQEAMVRSRSGFSPRASGQLPFDASAKVALESALREAVQLGHSHIGAEHLLLGLLHRPSGLVAEFLEPLDLDVDMLRSAVGSSVRPSVHPYADPSVPSGAEPARTGARSSAMQRFGVDLTERAREGRLDPVVFRDAEIDRVVRVLMRKKKNNPVLVGEAGVGKTAVAEGLALRVASGDVPSGLRSCRVVALEMGSLLAGARYRGDFEERVRDVLREAAADKDVVLFIDELHTLIGAGASEGSVDAANILKPALARGEIRVLGATTQDEFRRHMESDAALARRFQRVAVDEPSPEAAVEMVSSAVPGLESHHGVSVSPDAVRSAVDLSVRYVTDRQLPDKALDLLDEGCALARVLSEGDGMAEVDAAVLERVVEEYSGVPVGRASSTEREGLASLESRLASRVLGQEEAVSALSRSVRRARSGLRPSGRPSGSFLFAGPSGVGKTELAKALAREVFGSESHLLAFDMGEFSEKHAVARLFGAPPGYVGHEEGGQLTERVARRPYCVLLLDEIEKSHPDVFDALLQVLEEGRMTDGRGRVVDFSNVVVVMTSNLGSDARSHGPLGFSSSASSRERQMEEVTSRLPSEFVNRIDEVLVFGELSPEALGGIVDLQIADLVSRASAAGVSLEVSDEARALLASRGYDPSLGARPLRRLVQREVEDVLADLLTSHAPPERVVVEVVDGEILVAAAPRLASRPSFA